MSKHAAGRDVRKAQIARARYRKNAIEKKEQEKIEIYGGPAQRISKKRFLKAIKGSRGVKATISSRLGVNPADLDRMMNLKGREEIKKAFEDERDAIIDVSTHRLVETVENPLNIAESCKAARYFLDREDRRLEREERKKSLQNLSGASKAEREEDTGRVPLESLDLPVEVLKTILEATEKKEREIADGEQQKEGA